MKKYIIKRRGHKEVFDQRKVYFSCFSACRSCHLDDKKAGRICDGVVREVKGMLGKKKSATSNDIFLQIVKSLKKRNQDVAFMYETHRDIS
jgi:transcriptional regulator NrdR family protein